VTVANSDVGVIVTQVPQQCLGAFSEFLDGLDGVLLANQLSKDRGLVTGTGANFQDAITVLKVQCPLHESNDVRL